MEVTCGYKSECEYETEVTHDTNSYQVTEVNSREQNKCK